MTTSFGTAPPDASEAVVEDNSYKVVWSCLLLVEMLMINLQCAAHFQTLATAMVPKIAELLRLFNSRTTQLVLGAGAIHSAARLRTINAKHLALVTHCLGLVMRLLPHARAALMAQLPSKQHGLLTDLDKIKKDYQEHTEKVLAKFVSIVAGIVEHSLSTKIPGTDFDDKAKEAAKKESEGNEQLCPFLAGVYLNTKKMHQVLVNLLAPHHFQDVFSRIFGYVDHKVPNLFQSFDSSTSNGDGSKSTSKTFSFPITKEGKECMVNELRYVCTSFSKLPNVSYQEFTAPETLEKMLGLLHPMTTEANGSFETLASVEGNGEVNAPKEDDGVVAEKASMEQDLPEVANG
mmetsp:Transcript_3850/g.7267  ORF Transcript_3850/g.7267 Transcript_3850/m.7267 type:complete len:347 (-) Transcript_3850:1270-2310(-)